MMDNQDEDIPDRMTPAIAILGYGAAAVVIFLLFHLAVSVTG